MVRNQAPTWLDGVAGEKEALQWVCSPVEGRDGVAASADCLHSTLPEVAIELSLLNTRLPVKPLRYPYESHETEGHKLERPREHDGEEYSA